MQEQKGKEFTEKQIKKAQKIELKKQKYLQKYGVSYDEVTEALKKKRQGNSIIASDKTDIKKSKKNRKKISKNKSFLTYFSRYKGLLFCAITLSIFLTITGFMSAPVLERVSNFVLAEEWTDAIIWVLVLCGIFCLGDIARLLSVVSLANLCGKATRDIRNDISSRLINTTSSTYRKLTTGEVIQRATNDPKSYATSINAIWDQLFYFLTNLGIVAYFFIVNIWVGLLMVATLVIDSFLRMIQQKHRAVQVMRGSLVVERQTSVIGEFVRGSDDVKSLNLKKSMFSAFSKWNTHEYNSEFNKRAYNTTFARSRLCIVNFMIGGMLLLGIYLLSIGQIVAGAFVVMLRYFNTPLSMSIQLGDISNLLQDARISAKRMRKTFDETQYPQERFGTTELKDFTGKIEFRNVNFSYDNQPALQDVSFTVPAHQTLGIVGRSGEGKSTILSLINRLIDCESGEILLDGVKNSELTEQSLRTNIGMVPQSPYIFNTTIRQNLLYAKPDAIEQELVDALKSAQFYDFVMDKPDGMETFVGEGGITLSGGQRQRLAIARAFLTDCKVLMLDEATSALDNKNQESIKNVINQMKQKCTFIIVAHRLSTIVDCDNIIVLDDHKIIAQGNHQQLLKSCKAYNELYLMEDGNKEIE